MESQPKPFGGLSPGLVWVEGKGFVRPSIARALAKAGREVDWNRWSPGSGEDPKNTPYID
ncbi:hypothetical protein SEA_WALTZ_37 [Arthrobacter phage Waltz]|nr:hypothetical protein SEA_WALTZ_37 [Arthrobacter phage Waltz]